ncbi:Rad17 cell cycle checkpoint protein-domain-containing protein [Chaetomium strumarium]|uniref:Rad17 cell cycle checkpoint protein-domain-containing protein n=1 Tax=Chaetomium strumarium TaxID=1170767 RepID=A0AAJ0M6R9_9PEZI|nr:Rad17 cell cycle checkpoint protein-domain-containing protein [Chaetomium strumarium]
MAPPAKRRKRAIADDDSDDDEQLQKNTLKRFLFSSPDKTRSPEKPPIRQPNDSGTTEPAVVDSPSPLRKRTARALAAASRPPAARSPSTSPIKARTRAGTQRRRRAEEEKEKEKSRSGDLLTLFSKQAQRSQSSFSSTNGGSFNANGHGKDPAHLSSGKLDDIISDPISENNGEEDDDDVPLFLSSSAAASSLVGRAQAAHKRFAGSGSTSRSGSGNAVEGTQRSGTQAVGSGGGQRFLRQPRPAAISKARSTQDDDDDARPWSERFTPVSLEELAVHKRKVQDVRRWLDEVFAGRMRQRLLVLKGPAGSGKTTTLRLLARDMRCEVLEWRNPANSFGVAGSGYQSAAAQFEEFLGRGGKFGQLDVDSEEAMPPPPPLATATSVAARAERRLILVEEFPNTFMRSSTGLMGFRNAIIQFLAANTPALAGFGTSYITDPITPIIMVISETLLTTTSASADSFTAHRLLGPEILRHPGTGVIEFNPIAPTFLTKALELVVRKEARKSGRRRTPGPLVLQRLAEIGDIRSAVSSLEFLCVKSDDEADWGSKIQFTKAKRGSKDAPALTKGEQESLELVSRREATLGIFHAVGKVVYNKRGDYPSGSAEAAAEILPDYMAHLSRPKRSEVSVDTLIDEIGTDTHTFISALHENYALSCEQSSPLDPNSSLDYINGCLDYLSESDLLYPSWDIFFGGKGFGGGYVGKDSGSHILRQDEMAFQVAVRGLLFSLPSPVKRQTHPTGRGGDTYKMFYPTYLKLWRSKEELEGLVDMWATALLKGEDCGLGPPAQSQGFAKNGPSAFRKPVAVGNNVFADSQISPPARQAVNSRAHTPTAAAPPLLSLGDAARQELLLERLPYMAHIARQRRCSFGPMRVKDLERIVSFQGINSVGADEEEGEEGADEESGNALAAAESWATDKPIEEGTPRKRRGLGAILNGRTGKGKSEGEELSSLPMQSLVISDDDIEDD